MPFIPRSDHDIRKWDPTQARDQRGQWSSTGSSGAGRESHRGDLSRRLSNHEVMALESYVAGSDTINRRLRSGVATSEAKAIDKAMNKSRVGENMVVHRGFDSDKLDELVSRIEYGEAPKDELERRLVGKVFSDKAFVSTSESRSVAREFGSHTAEIHVSRSSRGLRLAKIKPYQDSGDRYSRNETLNRGEKELLLPRGSKFKITSARVRSGRIHLVLQHADN